MAAIEGSSRTSVAYNCSRIFGRVEPRIGESGSGMVDSSIVSRSYRGLLDGILLRGPVPGIPDECFLFIAMK